MKISHLISLRRLCQGGNLFHSLQVSHFKSQQQKLDTSNKQNAFNKSFFNGNETSEQGEAGTS